MTKVSIMFICCLGRSLSLLTICLLMAGLPLNAVQALNFSSAFEDNPELAEKAGFSADTDTGAEAAAQLGLRAPAPKADQRIVVNQVGYLPDAPKFALLLNAVSTQQVELIDRSTGKVVAELKLGREFKLPQERSGMRVNWMDFGWIKQPGEYLVRQGSLLSEPFRIGSGLYSAESRLMQRSYFLQRCGVALNDKVTDIQHAACHLKDGVYAHEDSINHAGEFLAASGGWHDAGDFGKYLAPAAVTVSRLMSLYLMQPSHYPDNALQIPESGNGKPDLLDEVAYELTWMLKMQRMDGAVYRKLSGKKWVSARVPEEDADPRYVYGISSPETAKFAASMAMAARAFRTVQPFDADTYQQAAELAWGWLEQHPDMLVDDRPDDNSGSGAYLSSDTDGEVALQFDDDDRLAAAIELYLTTGSDKYRDFVLHNAIDVRYNLYEWKDSSALSLWHLLTYDRTEAMAGLRAEIRQRLLERADTLLDQISDCPFGLANQRFVWGSNKMTAEEGITLLHAWKLTGDKRYLQGALGQIDYLFGRNAFGLSFVTAVGGHAVEHPLHLFGSAIQRTLPGLLVGGPNSLAQDKIAPFNKAMFSYVDHERAYSVNEYAIDYNATLIGLLDILAIYRSEVGNKQASK